VVAILDGGLFCVAIACEQWCVYKVEEEGATVEDGDIERRSGMGDGK